MLDMTHYINQLLITLICNIGQAACSITATFWFFSLKKIDGGSGVAAPLFGGMIVKRLSKRRPRSFNYT